MTTTAVPQPETGLTSGVIRETLPNGLTVLIKENHAAPVAAVLVSVKAGYFQEPDRVNGIAHVLEHMLFKGTTKRPEDEQIAREVRELGGYINAGTYYEETTYYLTVPSQHVLAAMDILSDACQNSLLDGEELAKEIEVIVQESLQKRDNPNAMLLESLYALAYDTHRIRRWRIGHPETLRAFRSEDLKQFVADNYRPDNMVLTVVGDVQAEQILEMARSLWKDLPRSDKPRELSPMETAHDGFRYQRLNGETKQRLLLFAMPVPDTLHPDAAALMVLSSLLSDGRSARLYRRLKEELKLVNSAWASYESFEQMGIFTLGAEVVGDDPLPAERALWEEVRRVQNEAIDPADLERIKTRIQTRRLFAQEEVMGMARNLSHYEQLGDYHLADELVERLRDVTPEDVQRVAKTYVQIEACSLLEYLPAESAAPAPLSSSELAATLAAPQHVVPSTDDSDMREEQSPGSLTILVRSQIGDTREIELPGGGKLLYKERQDLPIVAFNALFRGGKKREARPTAGLTNLMLKTSLKGTNGTRVLDPLSAEEIANRVESLGTGIGLSVGMEYFGWGLKSSRDVFREAFDIFAAVVSAPAFSPEEMEKEKQSIYAEIRRQQDNNYSLANDLYTAARFGDEHPYGLPSSGITEAVEGMYSSDLRNWYAAQVQPKNLIVSCVGDISAQEAVDLFGSLIEERWNGEEKEAIPPITNYQPPTTRILHLQKKQTAALMGFDGADMFSPDRYALDVLNEITSGMGGRLFRAVRGENSLAYQVTSAHRSRVDVGSFITYTSTAPENEERARDLILNALRELQTEPVTEEELRMAKASLVGEHVINMQTFAAQAGELAVIGVYGLPLDESERYLQEVQKVTAEQIRDVAIRYLNTERYWLGVVRGGTAQGAINTAP